MNNNWVAGKLLEIEMENYRAGRVCGNGNDRRFTIYGLALAIKYLQSFAVDHIMTEAEEKEYCRCLMRRQINGTPFPLIAIK